MQPLIFLLLLTGILGGGLGIREFKLSQANVGVRLTAFLVILILGVAGILLNDPSPHPESGRDIYRNTNPLPAPSLPTKVTPITRFNCIGVNYSYFKEFYFYQERKPLSVGFVNDIVPGAPVQTSGIQKGDIIVLVDSQPIKSNSSIQEIISNRNVGDIVDVKVIRPSSYQINQNGVQVTPPYTALDLKVYIASCSR